MNDHRWRHVDLAGVRAIGAGSDSGPVPPSASREADKDPAAKADAPGRPMFRARARIDSAALGGVSVVAPRSDNRAGAARGASRTGSVRGWIAAIAPAVEQFAAWTSAGIVPGEVPLILQLPASTRTAARELIALLSHHGICSDATEVEISWTMLNRDAGAIDAVLPWLVEQNVGIALTDVRRADPGLGILWRWPWSSVVLHRERVAGVFDAAAPAAIRALVSIAHTAGIDVVADGVDRAEQIQVLRALGCDRAQGLAVGMSLPAAEFEARHLAGNGRQPMPEAQ